MQRNGTRVFYKRSWFQIEVRGSKSRGQFSMHRDLPQGRVCQHAWGTPVEAYDVQTFIRPSASSPKRPSIPRKIASSSPRPNLIPKEGRAIGQRPTSSSHRSASWILTGAPCHPRRVRASSGPRQRGRKGTACSSAIRSRARLICPTSSVSFCSTNAPPEPSRSTRPSIAIS